LEVDYNNSNKTMADCRITKVKYFINNTVNVKVNARYIVSFVLELNSNNDNSYRKGLIKLPINRSTLSLTTIVRIVSVCY
jgi:hypothetical protein